MAKSDDLESESYVLSDKQYLEALLLGASQLGILPQSVLPRTRQAKAELAANGVVMTLLVTPEHSTATAAAPPPPDAESIRAALQGRGLIPPTARQIARWSRETLEQVAQWALASEPTAEMPAVLSNSKQRKVVQ